MGFKRRTLAAAAIVPAAVLGIGLSAGQAASAAPARVTTATANQQSQPYPGEALATMQTYYQAINMHDYQRAWNLIQKPNGSGGNAVSPQGYWQFVRGYRTTAFVRIHPYRELRTATSDSEYFKIYSTLTNGSTVIYNGWYMVNAPGYIVMAHVVQTGFITAPRRYHHPAPPPGPPGRPVPPPPASGPPAAARAAWLALAGNPAAGLSAGYLQVAGDLPGSDAAQIAELTQLSQLPATTATPQQMQEEQADVAALNQFFKTPGFTP
jgi:hypothetical protein